VARIEKAISDRTITAIRSPVNFTGLSVCSLSRTKYWAKAWMPYTPIRNRKRDQINRQ
jgi:hypothetical protein